VLTDELGFKTMLVSLPWIIWKCCVLLDIWDFS